MIKKAAFSAMVAVAALGMFATQQARALTASGDFDVTVNLYPKCEFTTAPTALTLNYVSFQASASENTQNFVLRCTNSLPYTFSLSGGAGASGTLVGLAYTLSTVTTGGAAAAGSTGNGTNQTFAIKGSIAASQSGDCAVDNSGNAGTQSASVTGTSTGAGTACSATSALGAHTLVITY